MAAALDTLALRDAEDEARGRNVGGETEAGPASTSNNDSKATGESE